MESHHREGRTCLTSLINAKQRDAAYFSWENQRFHAQLNSVLLHSSHKVVKAWIVSYDQVAGKNDMEKGS